MLKGKFTLSLPLRSQPTTTTSCAWHSQSGTGLSWSPSGWSTTWPSATTSFTCGQPCTRHWCGGELSLLRDAWQARATAFMFASNFTSKIVLLTRRYSHLSFSRDGTFWNASQCVLCVLADSTQHALQPLHPFCSEWTGVGWAWPTPLQTSIWKSLKSQVLCDVWSVRDARVALQGS